MKIKWSKEFAYYLGFLWSDGSIKRDAIRLEIVKEDLMEIMDYLLKIDFIKFNTYSRQRFEFRPTFQIYFSNAKLYDSFFSVYFNDKSNSSPTKLLEIIPEYLIGYFFNGLVDGDGNFYISKNCRTKQFSISSTYEQDWSYIENLFSKLNIKKYEIRKRKNKNGQSSVVRVSNYDDIYRLYKFLYPNEFEIGLKRKYDKCKLIIENKPLITLNTSLIEKSELVDKITEMLNVKKVAEYFNCSEKKIYNYCKKYKIKSEGFYQLKRQHRDEYLSLEESKKIMNQFGLKSKKEWIEFCKNKKRPSNIPSNPFLFYKNDGWLSYSDWLGFSKVKKLS